MPRDCIRLPSFSNLTLRPALAALVVVLGCVDPARLSAQETTSLSEQQIEELLVGLSNGWDAPEGEMRSMQAVYRLKKLDQIPDVFIQRAIQLTVSRDSHKRVPAKTLLKDVTFNVQYATWLIDAVGTVKEQKARYAYSGMYKHMMQQYWVKWMSEPGEKVVPLLKRVAVDESKTPRQRALARDVLERIEQRTDVQERRSGD